MNRKQANMLIIKKLQAYIKKNPGIRFNQMLMNLNIVQVEFDDYYTEPTKILRRIKNEH